jgi:hypothetical protein
MLTQKQEFFGRGGQTIAPVRTIRSDPPDPLDPP